MTSWVASPSPALTCLLGYYTTSKKGQTLAGMNLSRTYLIIAVKNFCRLTLINVRHPIVVFATGNTAHQNLESIAVLGSIAVANHRSVNFALIPFSRSGFSIITVRGYR